MFILITPDEDGNHLRAFSTEAELAVWLDDLYGEDTTTSVEFKDAAWFKDHPDPMYWPTKIGFTAQAGRTETAVLLKGEVIVPKAVEVVKRWEV
jgi:hypothetical protein